MKNCAPEAISTTPKGRLALPFRALPDPVRNVLIDIAEHDEGLMHEIGRTVRLLTPEPDERLYMLLEAAVAHDAITAVLDGREPTIHEPRDDSTAGALVNTQPI